MSEYHYKYDPPRRDRSRQPPPRPAPPRPPRGGLVELLVDLLVSLLVAIPSLLNRLWRALSRSGTASGQSWTAPAAQTSQAQTVQTQTSQAQTASGQAQSGPAAGAGRSKVKVTAGRGAIVLGGVLLGLFGTAALICLAQSLGNGALAACGALSGWGLLSLLYGLRKRSKARLYLKYLGLIGRRESVSVSALAQAAGRARKKVCRELQEMLDRGILPTGYLDLAGDRLVLSAQGLEDAPQEPPQPADDNDILRQIREVNDAIPDPVMSAKIDRIGEITGKILDYQRKNPGKAGQLRGFLSYYLPTTLKILRAYAQLDRQGVEGENISAAKVRIEGMMDKVVEGFEKQLDRLFQDEALDITSDVAVLEQMLHKDGLSSDGLTLEL